MEIKSIDTEKFSNLPISKRFLYFEMSHKADENRGCRKASTVLKMGSYEQDDLVFLIERQ